MSRNPSLDPIVSFVLRTIIIALYIILDQSKELNSFVNWILNTVLSVDLVV